jgi:hypothetical protein
MTDDILFEERQRFNQWWLWILLIGVNIFAIHDAVRDFLHQDTAHSVVLISSILIPLGVTAGVTLLLRIFRLDTQIKKDGVYVRFYPFHRKYLVYNWDAIAEHSIRTYRPLLEYGGWGLRAGFGKGTAFTVSGNKGIQLVFKNKTRLLIGTHKPDEVSTILTQLGFTNDPA